MRLTPFRQARLARAVLYFRELGRPQEALADLNALLAADPAYAEALLNRAMLAQENGRYQDALDDLNLPGPARPHLHPMKPAAWRPLLAALLDEGEA
jgi:tetratricopeptide (TPR) repeat protein